MPQLPNSIESEQALLGALMSYPDALFIAFENRIEPDDFFLERHRDIYRIIEELNDEDAPYDATNVITRLSDHNLLTKIGGAEYIADLTDLFFSVDNVSHYAKMVKEKSTLRKLINAASSIVEDAQANSYEFVDVLSSSEKKILDITRNTTTSDFTTSKQAMTNVAEEMKRLREQKGMAGVPSGYRALDNVLNGFHKGDLIILAARTSVGKTAFALNIALNAATMYDKSVAIFSLEMPTLQLSMRMLSAKAQVDGMKINSGKGLTNEDYGKINTASEILSKANIFFDDSSTIRVNEIAAKCRKLKADGTLDMIIIDYLQLITPSTRAGENRQVEVSEISRSLKGLARELDVPVIALAQVSRSVEKNKGNSGEPMLADLRESGAIEQDADVVIFLYREGKTNNDNDEEE